MADITPPVALAAYAGSAIAKAPPMKTAFNATRLAIAAFIVPYIFAFSPVMLFEFEAGTSTAMMVLQVIQICITSLLGIFGRGGGPERLPVPPDEPPVPRAYGPGRPGHDDPRHRV